MYGLTLLAAIALATYVAGKRWVNRGGDWDLIFRCAIWGVAAGIVGARLYHLATSWSEVPDEWWGPFAIWRGGLGVWGGIAAGCLVGGIVAKRAGRRRLAAGGLPRARAPARAGRRPARQLVEPGALREADRPAVGARDRPDQPAARVPRRADLPSDLPLRAALGLRRGGDPRLPDRATAAPAPAGGVRGLHRALLLRPLLDGAAAGRPRARDRRPADQRVDVAHRRRRRRDVVRPLAASRPARPAARSARATGAEDERSGRQARPTRPD